MNTAHPLPLPFWRSTYRDSAGEEHVFESPALQLNDHLALLQAKEGFVVGSTAEHEWVTGMSDPA